MSDTNITITKIIVYKFYSLLGRSCRILFSAFSAKKLVPEKEVSDLNLLLFTGLKGGKMLKAVLISIYNTWEKIPLLTVVTDGTPIEIIEEHLKFWPYPYKVKTWEDPQLSTWTGAENRSSNGAALMYLPENCSPSLPKRSSIPRYIAIQTFSGSQNRLCRLLPMGSL